MSTLCGRCLVALLALDILLPAAGVADGAVQVCGDSGLYINGNGLSPTADSESCHGDPNDFSGACAVVSGGAGNNATGTLATVSGGSFNAAAGEFSAVGGGAENTARGSISFVGGGSSNTVTGTHAVISGGYANFAAGENSAIGGGWFNSAPGFSCSIGGGLSNTVSGNVSTVAGGMGNRASDIASTISGGSMNSAANSHATVAGGYQNTAAGKFSVVAGGTSNAALGMWSFVAGGRNNQVLGADSLVLGSNGFVSHDSAAVFSYNSSSSACSSSGDNTVTICASGGLYLNGARVDATLEEHTVDLMDQSALLDGIQANVSDHETWLHFVAENITNHASDIGRLEDIVMSNQESSADERSTLNAAIVANQADISSLGTEISDLLAVDSVLQSNVTGLWHDVRELDALIAIVDAAVASNQGDIGTLGSDIASLQGFDSVLQSNVSELWHDVQDLSAKAADVEAAVSANEDAISSLSSEIDTVANTNVQLWSNITAQSTSLVGAHTRITELNGTNIALKLDSLNDGVQALETNMSMMDTSVGTLVDSIHTVNASLQSLQHAVSGLNVSTNKDSIDALEDMVDEDRQVLSALVANDSLLLSAITTVDHKLGSLSGNVTRNVTVAGIVNDVDALNNTIHVQQVTVAAIGDDIALHDSRLEHLDRVAANVSSDIEWLIQNATTQGIRISRLSHHVSSHMTSAQAAIDNLTGTVTSQQGIIQSQAATIAELNTTTELQEQRIEELESSLDAFNSTLHSMMVAMEEMSKATTFAGVVETTSSLIACGGDEAAPCTTTMDTETTYRGPVAFIQACYFYPCSDDNVLGAIAWGRELIVVASVDAEAVGYKFTLESDEIIWEETSDQPATSFVPRDLSRLTSGDLYKLQVTITFEDHPPVEATLEDLRFAAPPQLHGIDVALVNASAAVNWYDVAVNASDTSPLTYDYWIADTGGSWSYILESNASEKIRVAVPSTRDVTLEVVVTNAHSSSTTCNDSCPVLEVESSGFSSQAIFEEASQLLDGSEQVVAAFISGIDSGSSVDEMQDIFGTFVDMMGRNVTTVSNGILILHEFLQSGITSDLLDAIELVGARLSNTPDNMLELYMTTVDEYGTSASSGENALSNIADLDEYLSSVCVNLEAGSLPNSDVSTFTGDSYSLSCSSTETVVDVRTESAALITSVVGLSTATVSHWNTTINSTDDTSLLSNVFGFHIDSDQEWEEAEAVTDANAIAIAVASNSKASRKSVACKYFDESNTAWSDRGVVLMGLSLDDSGTMHVICSSSHFTLFGVGDDSEAAKVLDTKFSSLAGRVSKLNAVDLADPNASVNISILALVGCISIVFVLVIPTAKVCGRKAAIKEAALVFEQEGQLSKPSTIGSYEYEAILRKWVSGAQTMKLLGLEVLTSNAILGLLFHWDHEAIVFGRADKSMLLFGAILMTFVASAFLFDPNEGNSADFLVTLWASLVTAMLTNVLLLPVQHFLPYMVSNVNSVSSFTPTPVPLLKREMQRLICWQPAPRKKTDKEVMARALTQWIGLTIPPSASVDKRVQQPIHGVSTELHFLCCRVKTPSRNEESSSDWKLPALEPNELTRLVSFQRRVRQTMRDCRATRGFEFRAWYTGCRRERRCLSILSVAVMVVVTAFTLWICFLLSGAFNEAESVLWMEDVGKSLVLQVFVTDPAITLLVIFTKLLVSWVLLQRGKKRRKQELVTERRNVEKSMSSVSRKLNAAVGRAKALKFVCDTGVTNTAAIEEEVVQRTAAKRKCETDLDRILAAKQRLVVLKSAATRPNAPDVRKMELERVGLDRQESQTRNALAALEGMLAVLRSTDGSSEEEQRQAEQMVLSLQKKLDTMTKKKVDIAAKEVLLDDKPIVTVAETAIGASTPVVEVEEPDIERLSVRHSSASDVVSRSPTLPLSRSRNRIVPVTRTKKHRVSRRAAGPASMSSSLRRKHTEVASLIPKVKPAASPVRRKMTWMEIRQLQSDLKAKVASETGDAPKANIKRRPTRMSRNAIKAILERRERRRKLLEAKQNAAHKAKDSGIKSPIRSTIDNV